MGRQYVRRRPDQRTFSSKGLAATGKRTSQRFYWDESPAYALTSGLDVIISELRANMVEEAEAIASEIQEYMVNNHPYQNRTGKAENDLYAQVRISDKSNIIIDIGYNMETAYDRGEYYPLFLETNPRWYIVTPAVIMAKDMVKARILSGVK